MKFTSHFLGLAIACIAVPALAKPAYIASAVNLRAAPGTGSEIVAKIPGGSLVDTGGCDEGWCEVTWQEKKGFAIQSALDLSGRVPQQRAAAPVAPAYRQGSQGPQGPKVRKGLKGLEGLTVLKWLKAPRSSTGRFTMLRRRRPSFITAGHTIGLIGAGAGAGGDDYRVAAGTVRAITTR